MYRGDLARDGNPPSATLDPAGAAKLAPAWRAHLEGAVDGTPAVAGGLVIAGSAGGQLTAFQAVSGKTVWTVRSLRAHLGFTHDRRRPGLHRHAERPRRRLRAQGRQAPVGLEGARRPTGDLVFARRGRRPGPRWCRLAGRDQPLEVGREVALDEAAGSVRVDPLLATRLPRGRRDLVDSLGRRRRRSFVGVGNPVDGVLAFDVRVRPPAVGGPVSTSTTHATWTWGEPCDPARSAGGDRRQLGGGGLEAARREHRSDDVVSRPRRRQRRARPPRDPGL